MRASTQSECVRGVRRGDVLNMRSGPGAGNDLVGSIPPGACGVAVSRSECSGKWCIATYDGVRGWINAKYTSGGPGKPGRTLRDRHRLRRHAEHADRAGVATAPGRGNRPGRLRGDGQSRTVPRKLVLRQLPGNVRLASFALRPAALRPPAGGFVFYRRGGDPGRIRTCDLQIRNLPLYPAELRGHCIVFAP